MNPPRVSPGSGRLPAAPVPHSDGLDEAWLAGPATRQRAASRRVPPDPAPPGRGIAVIAAGVALGALGVVAAVAWMVVFGSRPAAAADAVSRPTPVAVRPGPGSEASATPRSVTSSATPPAAQATARTPRVEVVTARSERWADSVSATGNIAAWQEASVGAEATGLRLQAVRVQPGQRVTQGQELASFDDSTLRTELAQIRATVAEAEAAAAEARTNAGRARDVTSSGVLSGQQLTQFATAEETASARLDALRAAERLQQLRLERTKVRAPVDGVVAARSATVGAVPAPGQELFRLIVDNRLEWRAEVNAADLPGITAGMPVRIVPVGAPPAQGKVRQIAPVVDPATRRALVHVDLPAADGLRPGLFASGSIDRSTRAAWTLPQSAVVVSEGQARVWVVDAARTVRAVGVTTGRRRGDRVEILEGLDPSARVVAQGGAFLTEGDLVDIVPAPGTLAVDGRNAAASAP